MASGDPAMKGVIDSESEELPATGTVSTTLNLTLALAFHPLRKNWLKSMQGVFSLTTDGDMIQNLINLEVCI